MRQKDVPEQFSCDFRKWKFDATNPSKETRKTIALIGSIVIIILALAIVAFYLLKINLLSAGILGSIVAAVSQWIGKGRSP